MVTGEVTPGLRRQVLAICTVVAIVGVLLAWSGLSGLVATLRGAAAGAPLIAYAPYDVIALPLALTCFALAAMPLLPGAPVRTGRLAARRNEGRPRGAGMLFALAVAGVLAAVIITPVARMLVARIVTGQGYVTCPASDTYERHPPIRFARPASRCP